MGRGDKKTAKGKRFKGSFGKSRPVTLSPAKKAAAKKITEKATEKVTKKAKEKVEAKATEKAEAKKS